MHVKQELFSNCHSIVKALEASEMWLLSAEKYAKDITDIPRQKSGR